VHGLRDLSRSPADAQAGEQHVFLGIPFPYETGQDRENF
jgi:hypothetical protein